MGDDIRDRFRGGRSDYLGPIRPSFQPPKPSAPKPAPVAQPQPTTVPVNVFGQPIAMPAPRPAAAHAPQPSQPTAAPKAKRRGKKGGHKKLIVGVFALLLLAGGGAGAFLLGHKKAAPAVASGQQSSTSQQAAAPAPTGTIKMLITGDFLAYDSVNKAANNNGTYNYSPIMAPLKTTFDKYDIRFCNQATLGGGIGLGVSGYPTFNAPTEWSKGLEDLGCNLINVGTSHTNDKGQDAITAALNYYDNHTNILAIAGANRSAQEQSSIRYFTLKQVKFAFLSYTTSSQKPPAQPYSINLYNADAAAKDVAEARKNAQFVIVSMNWGKEDSGDVQPEEETIAQALTTAGADLIIGNGPHVTQPAKVLNGADGHQSLVWFSLGNAVNSQLPSDNLFGGIGTVNIDVATQHMTDPGFLPTYMHYEWTAAEKAAGKLDARHNLVWYPLDAAQDALAKSLDNTTIDAQTARLKGIITKYVPVTMLKSTDL